MADVLCFFITPMIPTMTSAGVIAFLQRLARLRHELVAAVGRCYDVVFPLFAAKAQLFIIKSLLFLILGQRRYMSVRPFVRRLFVCRMLRLVGWSVWFGLVWSGLQVGSHSGIDDDY